MENHPIRYQNFSYGFDTATAMLRQAYFVQCPHRLRKGRKWRMFQRAGEQQMDQPRSFTVQDRFVCLEVKVSMGMASSASVPFPPLAYNLGRRILSLLCDDLIHVTVPCPRSNYFTDVDHIIRHNCVHFARIHTSVDEDSTMPQGGISGRMAVVMVVMVVMVRATIAWENHPVRSRIFPRP